MTAVVKQPTSYPSSRQVSRALARGKGYSHGAGYSEYQYVPDAPPTYPVDSKKRWDSLRSPRRTKKDRDARAVARERRKALLRWLALAGVRARADGNP